MSPGGRRGIWKRFVVPRTRQWGLTLFPRAGNGLSVRNRHSSATRKVRAYPGKLDAVSRYLGHSSVSITLSLYCHTELSSDEVFGMEEV